MPVQLREEVDLTCMKKVNVAAAIIIDGDKVLVTQRGYGEFKDKWEFPGGKIEPGETPSQALVREIREELAADIEIHFLLTIVEYDYPAFHLTMHCYVCRLACDSFTLKEHEAAKWIDIGNLMSVDWLPADIQAVTELTKQPWIL